METHLEGKKEASILLRSFYARTGKRLFDVTMALVGLVLLLPAYAVLAILVKISSRGPVLYWQQRVGRGGRIFRIAKFRTMYEDAEQRGLLITTAGDSRITPLGRTLRRLKLDELPQLWNVLIGDMSLVGPRPEVPSYVVGYSLAQREVLLLRPGVTDPASILYSNEEKLLGGNSDPEKYYKDTLLPHKLEMSLQYLTRVSFRYDVLLVLRTLGCVFGPPQSNGPRPTAQAGHLKQPARAHLAPDLNGAPSIPGPGQNL